MDTKDPRCTADEILYVFSKSKLELITAMEEVGALTQVFVLLAKCYQQLVELLEFLLWTLVSS